MWIAAAIWMIFVAITQPLPQELHDGITSYAV
jgi:hypothetical protein